MNKKWLIIVIVAILFLLGAIGDWFYISNNKTSESQQTSHDTTNTLTANRTKVIDDTSKSAVEILNKGGSIGDAVVLYESTIATTEDQPTKARLFLDESILYFNNGDNEQALAIALKSEASEKSENIADYIAEVFVKMGNKQNAILYFQKAVSLVDVSDPESSYYIEYYNNKITELRR